MEEGADKEGGVKWNDISVYNDLNSMLYLILE